MQQPVSSVVESDVQTGRGESGVRSTNLEGVVEGGERYRLEDRGRIL